MNQVLLLERRPHKVVLVNECRALCVPMVKKQVTIQPLSGRTIRFEREEAGISVSPNSEAEVLGVVRGDMVLTLTGQRIPAVQFARQYAP